MLLVIVAVGCARPTKPPPRPPPPPKAVEAPPPRYGNKIVRKPVGQPAKLLAQKNSD